MAAFYRWQAAAGGARVFGGQVRSRLSAGGRWIRTLAQPVLHHPLAANRFRGREAAWLSATRRSPRAPRKCFSRRRGVRASHNDRAKIGYRDATRTAQAQSCPPGWALLHGLGRRGRTMKMEKHTDEKHLRGARGERLVADNQAASRPRKPISRERVVKNRLSESEERELIRRGQGRRRWCAQSALGSLLSLCPKRMPQTG